MRLRKTPFGLAVLLSCSSLLAMLAPQIAHAAGPYTCTWTGGGGNSNFSTAANWSACNSAAPQPGDGDNLVFSVTGLSASKTLTNDISSLTVGSITFSGTNSNHYNFTIAGNAFTMAGGMANNGYGIITANVTLSASQSFTGTYAVFGDGTTNPTISLNGKTLTIGSGSDTAGGFFLGGFSGTGNIAVQSGASALLEGSSPGWTSGSVTAASGASVSGYKADSFGSSSNTVTVASGGSLYFCGLNGATVPQNITVGGTGLSGNGAILAAQACGGGGSGGSSDTSPAKVTLSGSITLTANTTAYSVNTLTITGPLSGNYTITAVAGMAGTLVISSSNNTSQTPNGNQTAPAQTINYPDNSPGTSIDVPANTTAIVDGTYGDTFVESGGILKGTGTVGALSVSSGGTVAPGHSPGCITTTGNLTLNGTYQAEIGGTNACTDYDQLKVTGTVDLTGSTLTTTLYNGFKPSAGQTYTIISNDGTDAVTGTFNGLAEGATFSVGGYVFKVTYKGGDGNDVVLSVVSVPSSPNTGFGILTKNPLLTAGGVFAAAAGMAIIALRSRRLASSRR